MRPGRPQILLTAAALVVGLAVGAAPAQARALPAGGSVAGSVAAAGTTVAAAATRASCPRTYTRAHHRTCLNRAWTAYVRAWRTELTRVGLPVRNPRLVIWSGTVRNPCIDLSESDVVTGSFFCDKNRTIYASRTDVRYFTRNYAREAARVGVLASDAATAGTTESNLRKGYPLVGAVTEFAHESGHWVQQQAGQLAWYVRRINSSNFDRSNKYKVASELAADCLGGWVQGRVAAKARWRDKGVDRWGQHATMAELGGDYTGLRSGFRFTPENGRDLIGYGGSYSRVRFYDLGYAAGKADKRGISICARAAAAYNGSKVPPNA